MVPTSKSRPLAPHRCCAACRVTPSRAAISAQLYPLRRKSGDRLPQRDLEFADSRGYIRDRVDVASRHAACPGA
jgi:hypothetical protein